MKRRALIAGAALALTAATANAQDPTPQPYSPPPPKPVAMSPPELEAAAASEPRGFGLRLDIGAGLLTKLPELSLLTPGGVEMTQLGNGVVSRLGSMYMVSLGASVTYRTGSFLAFPIVGVEVGIPVATGYPGSVDLGAQDHS